MPNLLPGLKSVSVLPGLETLTGAAQSPAMASSGASLDSGGWVVVTGGAGRDAWVAGLAFVLLIVIAALALARR